VFSRFADKHAVKESIGNGVEASVQALGITSISYPGMGGSERVSMSPTTSTVATSMNGVGCQRECGCDRLGGECVSFRLSNFESLIFFFSSWLTSTCSNAPRVLLRSLYLSHQFSFHTLGDDYHALLGRYQLDITGAKIEVRSMIEISPYTSGGVNAVFLEGFSSAPDLRGGVSSSFDEPIASAISGSLDSSNLPIILSMYPMVGAKSKGKGSRNGADGSQARNINL